MENSNNVEISNGVIGFFDILGYKNFLENNDVDKPIVEILEKINSIPNEILSLYKEGDVKKYIESVHCLNLSDTIILSIKFENTDLKTRMHQFLALIAVSSLLMQDMFRFGLPLQGVIEYGEFVIVKNCFAGRPLLRAYSLCKDLNIISCVFGDGAKDFIKQLNIKPGSSLEQLFIKYPVPRKSKDAEEILTLNFFAVEKEKKGSKFQMPSDIKQFILDSFWKHNKTVGPKVESIINQTEQYFRYIHYKYPNLFNAK